MNISEYADLSKVLHKLMDEAKADHEKVKDDPMSRALSVGRQEGILDAQIAVLKFQQEQLP